MKKQLPLVSIGMPVFNGENYINQAIESVINQTYSNWELIISDNGSTDNTQEICKNFYTKDKRIRYYRSDKNYGASRNYNRTFELSNGKYFKWLAHDDKLMPDNIEKSVKILDANEDIVICASSKMHINANGEKLDINNYENLDIREDDNVLRFKLFLNYFSKSNANADFIMGVIRSQILKRTKLIGNFTSSDLILLAELVLNGSFYKIDEPLFQRRIHHGISTSIYNNNPELAKTIEPNRKITYRNHAQIAKWYDPNGKVRYIPHFKWFNELIRSISTHNSNKRESQVMVYYAIKWFLTRFNRSVMKNIRERFINKLIVSKQ